MLRSILHRPRLRFVKAASPESECHSFVTKMLKLYIRRLAKVP